MGSTAQMEERALDWKEGASKGQESGMRREVERVGAWVHLLFVSSYKIPDPTPPSSAAASGAPNIMQPAPEGGALGLGHRRGRPPRSAESHEGAEPTRREKADGRTHEPHTPGNTGSGAPETGVSLSQWARDAPSDGDPRGAWGGRAAAPRREALSSYITTRATRTVQSVTGVPPRSSPAR